MSHYINEHYIDQLRDLLDLEAHLLKELVTAEAIQDEDWQVQLSHEIEELRIRIERARDYIYNY